MNPVWLRPIFGLLLLITPIVMFLLAFGGGVPWWAFFAMLLSCIVALLIRASYSPAAPHWADD